MSIRQGNKVIAGHINYHPDLFDHKWADHILNDISWLRADTFSWQDGSVYEAAYNHLADDISGKSLSSETIAGVTVQFYLADDGHKICPDSQESNVASIYSATGVAWYYIIDTVNERFKLPRTKYGFDGLRDTVGKYIEESVPNITGNGLHEVQGAAVQPTGATNAFYAYNVGGGSNTSYSGSYEHYDIGFDASRSSSAYKDGAAVQQRGTQQYLYFYIGNFTQTAIENTAGLNASLFNDKADIDFNNTNMIDYVVEKQDPTSGNNYTWYRKYANGWVEQGGIYTITTSSPHTINLPITMANTNYSVSATTGYSGVGDSTVTIHIRTDLLTTSTISIQKHWTSSSGYYYWQVSGMAA